VLCCGVLASQAPAVDSAQWMHLHSLKQCGTPPRPDACFVASLTFCAHAALLLFLLSSLSCSWHTYMLLVYMHEVPDLSSKGGIRRLDRYDQLAEYVWGESPAHS
jgi:hypothetical protein